MKMHQNNIFQPSDLRQITRLKPNPKGNVLLYVVVLMLIFGVLGVVMVSLFTSTTASTVTRNDSRRAIYMAESGMRYAFSELRKAKFDQDFILDDLSAKPYNVTNAGSFEIKLLNPLFSPTAFDVNQVTLSAPVVNIPSDYAPPAGAYVVNIHSVDPNFSPSGANAQISGVASQTDNTFVLDLAVGDDFIANSHEQISFAVLPVNDPPGNVLDTGDSLDVALEAQNFFPRWNGAISIFLRDYAYEERIDDPDNNKVTLTNLSALSTGEFPINNVDTSTFVVLSPSNYIVAPEGKSDNVIYGGTFDFSKNIFNPDYSPGLLEADFPELPPVSDQSTPGFFTPDTDAGTLNIGSGVSGGSSSAFGSAFFDEDRSIGGAEDYCEQGACKFFLGVRAFFLLNFESQGDGITFTLLGQGLGVPANNSATSVGGDIQLSELMAYAGDSRLFPNPDITDDSDYLATDPDDRGLDPPKLAVEFDTRTDRDTLDYCSNPFIVNQHTRNDPDDPPLSVNEDAVQYVFWGEKELIIPCRGNNPSYDDNRHDTGGAIFSPWNFATLGAVRSSPAIGADGTIYVGSNDGNVYAINPDGTPKGLSWPIATGGPVISSPAIEDNGTPADISDDTIYVGSNDGHLYAINTDGTQKWRFPAAGSVGDIESSPAIAADGTIYVGSNDGNVYAINPADRSAGQPFPQPSEWAFAAGGHVRSSPAVDQTGGTHDGTIYVGSGDPGISDDGRLYAINPDGSQRWVFDPGPGDDDVDGSPALDSAGKIYVGADGGRFFALDPDDRLAGLPFPTASEWSFNTGADVESKPAISESRATIYVEAESHVLYARNITNGDPRWAFDIDRFGFVSDDDELESSPSIGADGTIYVGSKDGRVYAVNHDDRLAGQPFPTANESTFITGDEVRSTPAIGADGTVYVGSDDDNVYAINQNENPRNIKDLLLTAADLGSGLDLQSSNNWLNGDAFNQKPWAIRLEVDRSILLNANGNFDYQLSLWIRQCQALDCSDINGTFFSDTRLDYEYTTVATLPMTQQFELNAGDHADFDRFFFGFTGATGPGQTQDATVSQFNLSFIRLGDPVITSDPDWLP
jgi:outer membrane protein assembly factor BamB